ncbi:peptidyl-prolyl cis-trans isomerase, EpsD family [Sphingomonas sp. MAH-20]|uniref:Peptidyl-prolyl cis-trans isomerase, EpsD family n=1 Tax=Sphingomonas horti TaxID=2682842 RepID=A0A6I4IZS4_9SPHN|nr:MULTISPECIES: SurA N-terminal domain-containing protein [Sphingomonas]MBA2920739.1 SurA N-terminal domain-containing protein [Sphingomonas sp. CGMCC 1.13658]MVO77675.1 peptidyl-prolyl cis-trans isomerase, EpsD family [Sphingomonas horti]
MTRKVSAALLLGTALLLAGCGKKGEGELEKGQVVATVDGKDITIHELNAELQGAQIPPNISPEQKKQLEQAALQQVVNRRILSDIARERGLDKTPMFLLQERRAEENILVQMLQRQMSGAIKQPTQTEIDTFIAQNPDLFAERKIFTIDQIQFQAPRDPAVLRKYQPLTTMDQVEAMLKQDGLEYKRAPSKLDVATANPQLVEQVLKMPKDDIFLIPAGRVMVANKITGTEVQPLTGDQANQLATAMLQQRKFQDLLKRDLEPKVKKAESEVKYQAGFGPAKKPAAPVEK